MAIVEEDPRITGNLEALLSSLRRRIRTYVALEGAAWTVATALVAFWILLAIDWTFEPPRDVRLVMLLAAAAATAYAAYRGLIDRLRVPLPNRSMAVLLERWFPFRESLLTTIEMSGHEAIADETTREMLAGARFEAEEHATSVNVNRVFNFRPLTAAIVLAAMLSVSVAAMAASRPQMFRFAVARLATVTDALWPRTTRLVVEGFKNGEAVIAKGGEFKLVVRADTTMEIPERVQLRYTTEDGTKDRKYMVRIGVVDPERDKYQNFEYLFQSLLVPLKLEVRGGDARVGNLRIRVVDSPTVTVVLRCQYPSYMQLAEREIPATAVTPLPQGTRVSVRATANKPLQQATIERRQGQQSTSQTAAIHDGTSFEFVAPSLDVETTLDMKLLDTDGVRNRDAIEFTLVPVLDTPPEVDVRLSGIGSAITPNARLPLSGDMTDDYGVAHTWITTTVDEQPASRHPLPLDRLSVDVKVNTVYEVRDLGLKPEQRLLVGVEAADNRKLPGRSDPVLGEPNVGTSERWLLDVVTPDQLRAQLESRELNIRQRFESLIAEMIETRDSLARLEALEAKSTSEAHEPSRLRVSRARQNGEKNAAETLGVAAAFDGIRDELVNNRIDTEELRLRLKGQIADPLRHIAGEMFPALGQRLVELEAALPGTGLAEAHRRAVAQADALLVALEQVRNKMLELETFNEAVELLRGIIASQREIGEQTKKQRSAKVRKLLEE